MKSWLFILTGITIFTAVKTATAQDKLAPAKEIKTVELSDPKFDQIITCNFAPDKDPEFLGGEKAFIAYLTKNLTKSNKPKDVIEIAFDIEEHGLLINPKIEKGINKILDKKILKQLSISPAWKPGIRNGKAMRKSYLIPIKV